MWKLPPIILASESQRRHKILSQLHISYQVMIPNIDEDCDIVQPHLRVCHLAQKKAETVQQHVRHTGMQTLILAADTIVAINTAQNSNEDSSDNPSPYRIFEKPSSIEHARDMLIALSGTVHTVFTGMCVLTPDSIDTRFDTSKVYFTNIDNDMLERYLSHTEWKGVAGAYAIQGLGACFISRIEGNYSTVMGLSIPLLLSMLQPFQNLPFLTHNA